MATSLDQSTLQRTKDTLGKIIKKPPLTDKLLNRPPFRYLHDIVTEVNKATGFFKGLYTGQELDAKSIQDKEAKVAFLQKAVDVLSFVQGDVVKVKASKIVAGQEVERTNEFLQLLSIAILKKLDSTEAVQRVINGEKPARKKGERKEGTEGKRARSKERPGEGKPRSREGSRERKGGEGRGRGKEKRRETTETEAVERPQHKPSRTHHDYAAAVREGKGGGGSGEDEGLGSETKLDRPHSAKGHRRRVDTGDGEKEEEGGGEGVAEMQSQDAVPETHPSQQSPSPPPTVTQPPPPMGLVGGRRPGTARPAPPRVVHHSSSDDLTARVPMEMSVAPPNVILDAPSGAGDDGEGREGREDEDYVVGNSAPLAPPTNKNPTLLPAVDDISDQPEGALTKAIVATKERLEGVGGRGDGEGGEVLPGAVTPAQRKREMEVVRKEMEKLREDIQLLCRYTNPMGRVMDYLQEDTDTMVQELERWRTENGKHREGLRREENITEHEIAPLKAQLEEVELHMQEQRDRISATKANIIRQDTAIQQLLNSLKPPT